MCNDEQATTAFLCFGAVLGVKRGLPLLKKTQTLELLSPSVKQDNQVSGTHRYRGRVRQGRDLHIHRAA